MNEELSDAILRALGNRIRELRTDRGYSQESFADQCGVHRNFMGTVERGESNLSFSNIAKVTATLGITLSVLFVDLEVKAQQLPAQTKSPVSEDPKNRQQDVPNIQRRSLRSRYQSALWTA